KDAGLKGVAFFDAGTSFGGLDKYDAAKEWNNNGTSDENKAKRHTKRLVEPGILMSYGLGIRWFSPIGPLRLEYGIPINPRAGVDKEAGKLALHIVGIC